MKNANTRVIMAMSGGVDSSLAARLLVQQGYDVIGITLKLYKYEDVAGHERGCCSLDQILNAQLVCRELGIPHHTLDMADEFSQAVVANFVSEYKAGRTPNPCIMCNTTIKWQALMDRIDEYDAEFIATGHYARILRDEDNRQFIARGKDPAKDQSYALWGIKPENLARTIFPLGELTKQIVRGTASEAGLVTADTPESQEICFIPDNDYRRYIREQHPDILRSRPPGEFVNSQGEVIGQHDGIYHYTVGQRKGLGLATGERIYVNRIDPETNQVHVGTRDEAASTSLIMENCNWFIPVQDLPSADLMVQIRYNHPAQPARVHAQGRNSARIEFEAPQHAITPGQSAVVYTGDRILVGGIIGTIND